MHQKTSHSVWDSHSCLYLQLDLKNKSSYFLIHSDAVVIGLFYTRKVDVHTFVTELQTFLILQTGGFSGGSHNFINKCQTTGATLYSSNSFSGLRLTILHDLCSPCYCHKILRCHDPGEQYRTSCPEVVGLSSVGGEILFSLAIFTFLMPA